MNHARLFCALHTLRSDVRRGQRTPCARPKRQEDSADSLRRTASWRSCLGAWTTENLSALPFETAYHRFYRLLVLPRCRLPRDNPTGAALQLTEYPRLAGSFDTAFGVPP